jgi:uncharacterized protein
MNSMKTINTHDKKLSKIIDLLAKAYRPDQIYLFGSTARGEAGPNSDYDLMVIVPDRAPSRLRRSRLAYERLWGTGVAADVLVWTRSAFEFRVQVKASLPATILREGRLLYAS